MNSWRPPETPFKTLCATVRDWSRHGRIAELQGLAEPDAPDLAEETLGRIQISADGRVHEEWPNGRAHHGKAVDEASNWPLFDPSWLADHPGLVVLGEREVAGRTGVAVEAIGADGPARLLLPGANRCVGVFDQNRAILLRCEAWLDDELLMVEELIEVVFDEPCES